jgi:hypothetical protein
MAKKDRYSVAKSLIEGGSITNVRDLLAIIDKTPLSRDVHISPIRFNKLISDPTQFMMSDCISIADVIGVDPKLIVDLVYAEILLHKRKRK